VNTPVVLLVNSDRAMLGMLRRTLAEDGYFLLPAQNGQDALEILEQHHVNLILADEILPDMSGTELLDRVRMKYPSMLTMMLTSTRNVNVAVMANMNVGIYKFFLKPLSPKHLRASIRKCLRPVRRSYRHRSWVEDVVRPMLESPAHGTA